ncbi:MAG: TolC family protein [Desulfobacteraceae bacterium]|nr:TolC family protein [Desulfobacteraceae bacterium]
MAHAFGKLKLLKILKTGCMALWAFTILFGVCRADDKNSLENITELDLKTAAQIALKKSPTLAAAQARLEQARLAVKQAWAAYWPSLDAKFSGSQVEMSKNDYEYQSALAGLFGSSLDNPQMHYEAGLTASWLLFDGFARKFSKLAAEQGEKLGSEASDDVKRMLLSSVTSAFLSAQRSEENIAIANADLEFNRRLLKEARFRYEVGSGALSDVLNFQVKANSSQTELILARHRLKTAMIGLAALLGLPEAKLPDHLELSKLSPATVTELEQPVIGDLLETAYRLRPDLKQNNWALEQAGSEVQIAKANYYYPSVSLSASYNGEREENAHFESDDFGNVVALSLSYNIFSGGLFRARHQQARVKLHEVQKAYEDLKINVTSQVRNTAARVDSAQQQLALQRESAKLVKKNRSLVEKEYKAGVGSLVRLNEAQRDLTAAQFRLAAARVELRQAWYDLLNATGEILTHFRS